MAGELPEDWDPMATPRPKLRGRAAEDPNTTGNDSMAELPDPMADGAKDPVQDPTGSKNSRNGGVTADGVNGRMNFSRDLPETDDYGNLLPSIPTVTQGKVDSLPSFEPNPSGGGGADQMLMDEDSNEFSFVGDPNGPAGDNGCSPPPPEPSDFGGGVLSQNDQKQNDSAAETLPTVSNTDIVPESPVVTEAKVAPKAVPTAPDGGTDHAESEYVNYQYGEDGYLYFQDKEGNYYYQGEDGLAYRWTGATEESQAPKAASAAPVVSAEDPKTTAEAVKPTVATEIEAPTTWPGFPTGWPPQAPDFSAYYGQQYAAAAATGPYGGGYFPPGFQQFPYGYYDYGSSSSYVKGPINLTETKFELSKEKKDATKSLVSRQLKVMASLKGKLTTTKKPAASQGEDGRDSAASASEPPTPTNKVAENGTAADSTMPELPISTIKPPAEKKPSKFSDPVAMGTYGPPVPKPIDPVKTELLSPHPKPADPVPPISKPVVTPGPATRYRPSPQPPRVDERREYDERRRYDDRRRRDSRTDRYSPDWRQGRRRSRDRTSRRYSSSSSSSRSSDSRSSVKNRSVEKPSSPPLRKREDSSYSPTKPSQPREVEETLLVKAANECRVLEWPMHMIRKTWKEPVLTFSCKPDTYESFAALMVAAYPSLPPVAPVESQACEDMELDTEEAEDKSQEPMGPKLPPTSPVMPPSIVPVPTPLPFVRKDKISINYTPISYPSIVSTEKPAGQSVESVASAVHQNQVKEEPPMGMKKFGPVEPPVDVRAAKIPAEFKPIPAPVAMPTSRTVILTHEPASQIRSAATVNVGNFGGRSKAQMDAELERLRLEALASMENAKNVLAQVAKLSGKSEAELSSVQVTGKKSERTEEESSSSEGEEETPVKSKRKQSGKKRDKKKHKKERQATKVKKEKPVVESENESSSAEVTSSSDSESDPETPPKRRGKKEKKQKESKKKASKKHKGKQKVSKGRKRKAVESDDEEVSSEEESSESEDTGSRRKKKKREKKDSGKRRRKPVDSSESEESSEEIPLAKLPSKKKRRVDASDKELLSPSAADTKQLAREDDVPSMDEGKAEKSKSKGKKKGKGKKGRSPSPESKKKRNKRERDSSSSDEEDSARSKHHRSRHSESGAVGSVDKSSKAKADEDKPQTGQSGKKAADADAVTQQQQEQTRKSRWNVNAHGHHENEPLVADMLPKPTVTHIAALGKDVATSNDHNKSERSGLMTEYEMFENELFNNSTTTDGSKVSLYDDIPGLPKSQNVSVKLVPPPSLSATEIDEATMSLNEQRQLLARLEGQSVDANMRGMINQLKAALKTAEGQLADRSGSKSMSETSSVDASPSPGGNLSRVAQLGHSHVTDPRGGNAQVKRKDEPKRRGKGRESRSSSTSPPPPPPPPRRPLEDPRLKTLAPIKLPNVGVPQQYTVVATYRPMVPVVPPPPTLYKPVAPVAGVMKSASSTGQSSRQSSSSYQRH